MRRLITKVCGVLVLAAFAVPLGMGAASALTQPVPKATGGVAVSDGTNLQYLSFSAFQQTPAKGSVDYTNFSYGLVAHGISGHTGIWAVMPGGQFTLEFGGTYDHTITVQTVTALSTHALAFTATGTYNGAPSDPNFNSTVSGTVVGTSVTMVFDYVPGANDSQGPQTLSGSIDSVLSDGSATGFVTAGSLTGMAWSVFSGGFVEVYGYTGALVTTASVSGQDATFSYTIPPTAVAFGGVSIPVSVHDGATTPAPAGDSITLNGAGESILSGNITVH